MQKLPLEFKSEAKADHLLERAWTVTSGSNETLCAIPQEFGGQGGGFSPEDLFLQAAINCFVGTFKVIAKLSKVSFEQVEVKGKLSVDKNAENKTVMKSVHLDIYISGVERPDRIESVVAKTIKDGFILNSIKSELTYSLKVMPADTSLSF